MEDKKDLNYYKKRGELKRKHGESELTTLGESALSSATFGLSDQAAIKLDLTTPEAIAARREFNPASHIAGTAAGVILPTLATGGTSTIAKAASIAPTALASKAGSAVSSAVASAIKGRQGLLAKDIIQRSIPLAAGSAVEGAAYGLGELISENALGNKKFNAESALSSLFSGAATGAALGGSFGIGGALVKPIKEKAKQFISKQSNYVDSFHNIAGTKPSESIKLQKIHGDKLEDIQKNIVSSLKDEGNFKVFTSAKKINEGYQNVIEKTEKELDNVYDLIGKNGIQLSADDVLKAQLSKIDDIIVKNTRNSKAMKELIKNSKDELGVANKKVSKDMRQLIDNPELKDDLITLLNYRMDIQDSITRSKGMPLDAKMLRESRQNIDTKLKSYYKSERDDISLKQEALMNMRNIFKDKIDDMAKQVPDVELSKSLQDLNKRYHDFKIYEKQFARKAENSDAFLDIITQKDAMTTAAGALIGVPDVVAAYVGVNKLLKSDIVSRAKLLSNIERSSKDMESKLSKSITSFFSKASKPAKSISTKILSSSPLSFSEDKKPKNEQEAFSNIQKNLTELRTNPNALTHTVGRLIGPYQTSAPDTTAEMVQTFMRKMEYLEKVIPKPKYDNGLISKLNNKPSSLSTIELSKFRKIVNTLEDPTIVLDDLNRGTLNKDQVEALMYVYPETYNMVRSQVMEHITENPDLSYSKKLNLGILLDLPTDRSITTNYIQQFQLSYANEQESQDSAPSNLDIDTSKHMTEVEKLS